MSTVKKIYLKQGRDNCAMFFKERLKSDLEFASNTYKSAVQDYKRIVGDGLDPMGLIPNSLLVEHQKAISEYENHSTKFINMLWGIPKRRFLGNTIMCIFFSFVGYMVPKSDIGYSLFFWTIAAINIWFIIRRFSKIYGNRYFDNIEDARNKIEKEYYHAVQVASNRIQQEILKMTYERTGLK